MLVGGGGLEILGGLLRVLGARGDVEFGVGFGWVWGIWRVLRRKGLVWGVLELSEGVLLGWWGNSGL